VKNVESTHHMFESSLGESIRLRIEGSREMSEGDVGEGASQQLSFEFPTFHMARMEITLAIDPVNDDFGVANDLEVIKRPIGSEQECHPKAKQFGLCIGPLPQQRYHLVVRSGCILKMPPAPLQMPVDLAAPSKNATVWPAGKERSTDL